MKNNKNPLLISKKHKAFTLVELIVVITILAILGTIGFVSLSGYSLSARDSTRISNISSLKKGLDILNVVAGNYPVPESFVTLSLTGGYAIYQGFAKENTERVSRISAGAALDPSDKSMYITYSTTSNGKKMQLMTFLENGSAISLLSPLIPGVYASSASDYSKRYPYALGDNLGIVINATGTLAPVQETATGTLDLTNTPTGYTVYFDSKTSITGTGSVLASAFMSGSVVYNTSKTIVTGWTSSGGAFAFISSDGNAVIPTNCNQLLTNSGTFFIANSITASGSSAFMNGNYLISPSGTSLGASSTYCDMTTDGGGYSVLIDTSFVPNLGAFTLTNLVYAGTGSVRLITNLTGTHSAEYILPSGVSTMKVSCRTYSPKNIGALIDSGTSTWSPTGGAYWVNSPEYQLYNFPNPTKFKMKIDGQCVGWSSGTCYSFLECNYVAFR